ncbi:sialate O-acetylesterase [Niabella terrae]
MKYALTICILWLCLPAAARIVLPKILGNGMVLQQGRPVVLWGQAEARALVTVKFKDQQSQTRADDRGAWRLQLRPMKASFAPADLRIQTESDQVLLRNILVGEVWLCSGQSNMEFAMRKLAKLKPPAGKDWPVDAVAQARDQQLHIFLAERKHMAPDSLHQGWAVAQGQDLSRFSALAYFFGRQLRQQLKVPVGLIAAAVPGSGIERWMPRSALAGNSGADPQQEIGEEAGSFYTAIIAPLGPFALKGFLWYQGENNCFLMEGLSYSFKMQALIHAWRQQWKDDNLPFYYIQIAPYYYSRTKDRPFTVYTEPEFWEAQAAVLQVPHTTMIATIDLNDDPADLHPVNKWDLGKRAARAALSKTYGVLDAPAMGPVFKRIERLPNGWALYFDGVGSGLKGRRGAALGGFEIGNETTGYQPVRAFIKDDLVWIPAGKKKKTDPRLNIRYAWREYARAELYNQAGLPALPFRTNNQTLLQFNAADKP